MIHRGVILCATLLFQMGAAVAQNSPSKRGSAASGYVSPLPPSSSTASAKRAFVAQANGLRPHDSPSVSLLGSVVTASPAESFALSGNLAYVCDNNEVSVVDVTVPQNPQIVATALSGLFQASSFTYCALLHGTLAVFSDQFSTLAGDTPGFSAFSLSNALQPQLIAASPINKRFFGDPSLYRECRFCSDGCGDHLPWRLGRRVRGPAGGRSDKFRKSGPARNCQRPEVDAVYGGATPVLGPPKQVHRWFISEAALPRVARIMALAVCK